MELFVLTLADTGSVITCPDGKIAAFDRPDAAQHAAVNAASDWPCRQIEVRSVRGQAPTERERNVYKAILEWNAEKPADPLAEDNAWERLEAAAEAMEVEAAWN